jgi:hypothetical protein
MKEFFEKQKSAISFILPLALCLLVAGPCGCARTTGIAQNSRSSNGYDPPIHLADLENQSINESSGVAASRLNANLLWTHNDSGDGPFIYAFDRKGKHLGAWKVAGAQAQDWEDMAIGPGPAKGQSYIYMGDIGDNSKRRGEIIIYRVVEPSVDGKATTGRPMDTKAADVIRLKYPDGKYDAEALLVHPSTGDLYIVTKVMSGAAGVYKLSATAQGPGVLTLVRVGEVQLPNPMRGFLTGGDISPDGRRVVLCDYLGGYELVLPEGSGVAFDEIWKQTPVTVNIGNRRQGEAICYRADGQSLLVTSEGVPCPLIEIMR